MVNSLPLCEGLITRRRYKDGILEESALDFFVVCNLVLPYITKMTIDENKKHILTNYKSVKSRNKATDSDHFTEYIDLNLEIVQEKPVREELFNFKNKEAQIKFKELSTKTNEFTDCFKDKKVPILKQVEKWRQVLKKFCFKAFKKIRIKKKKMSNPLNQDMTNMMNKRNNFKKEVRLQRSLKI